MREDGMKGKYVFYMRISGIFALAYTLCLYRNPNGITFPVFVASVTALLIAVIRAQGCRPKRGTLFCFAGMLLLGISLCVNMNLFIQNCNHIAIMLLLAVSVFAQFYEMKEWGVVTYALNGMLLIGDYLTSVGSVFSHAKKLLSDREAGQTKRKHIASVLSGIGIAAVFLLTVMPLLIGSDLVFADMFEVLWRRMDVTDAVRILLRFAVGFWLFYTLLAAVLRRGLKERIVWRGGKVDPVTGVTFLGIMTAVYLFYCGIQMYYLFLRGGQLPAGVTYADYAHTGFYQLLTVTVINMFTIGACIGLFEQRRMQKIFQGAICVCTCVMTASAAYRMFLYIRAYHLTLLRILALWLLTVIFVLILGMMARIFWEGFPFCRYGVAVIAAAYILFSFFPVDRVIASYFVAHKDAVTYSDMWYLMDLSVDAAPVVARIDPDRIVLGSETAGAAGEIMVVYTKEDVERAFASYDTRLESLMRERDAWWKWNASVPRVKEALSYRHE